MTDLIQASIRVIKDNQASTGAYIASPNFSQYGYSWLRDGMWIAHSMDCVGEHDSATAFHQWVADVLQQHQTKIEHLIEKTQQGEIIAETDYLPTRFTVDGAIGTDDWTEFQLDGYGAWLWGAVQHCRDNTPQLWQNLRPSIALLIRYLDAIWYYPNYDCWEEFRTEQHLSTFAALYGGLKAVADYDPELVPDYLPEQIRTYSLSNGVTEEGHLMKFIGNHEVDASLLWSAIPFQMVASDSSIFLATLGKIEKDIYRAGGGVYRYCDDTYFGGGEWILLTCWLAWAYIELGRFEDAKNLMSWVEMQANEQGDLPEQVEGNLLDNSYLEYWVQRWGKSASPLLWSHAMYIIVDTKIREIT